MRVGTGLSTDFSIAMSDLRKAGLASVASNEDRAPKAVHLGSGFASTYLAKEAADVGVAFWPKRERHIQMNRMLSPFSKVSEESDAISIPREPTHALRRVTLVFESRSVPNQAPEPTPPSVTICADAQLAPAGVVAHL